MKVVRLGRDVLGDLWIFAVRLAKLGFSKEEAIRLLHAMKRRETTYRKIADEKKKT